MSGTAQMPGMLSPRSALDIPSDLDNPVNDRNPFVLNQDQDLPPSVNELPIPSIGDEDVENS